MESFRKIKVWEKSHHLTLAIYKITRTFPSDERFGLISQIRRSAASIPANIAEGYKRESPKEKIRFYNIAESSLEETKYHLILAHDLGYADTLQLQEDAREVGKMLYGFKKAIKKYI